MTDDTPPRLYISTITSDLTPQYRALRKPHPGAVAYVPEGAGVRVKPLVWSDRGYDWSWWATNTTLDYRIRRYAPNEFWVDVDGETIEADAPQPSFDAAATLANSHHEARIMAALEPMDATEPTPGQIDLLCLSVQDVINGRLETGDAAADLAALKEHLDTALNLTGFDGENG